jgi:uncharacterized protein (UPF0335 family)
VREIEDTVNQTIEKLENLEKQAKEIGALFKKGVIKEIEKFGYD